MLKPSAKVIKPTDIYTTNYYLHTVYKLSSQLTFIQPTIICTQWIMCTDVHNCNYNALHNVHNIQCALQIEYCGLMCTQHKMQCCAYCIIYITLLCILFAVHSCAKWILCTNVHTLCVNCILWVVCSVHCAHYMSLFTLLNCCCL